MGDAAKTIALLAVIAAACLTGSEFSAKTPPTPESAVYPRDLSPVEPASADCDKLSYAAMRLAPGRAVLIGSLDQTAQQHQLRLVWRPDLSTSYFTPISSHTVLSFPEEWAPPVEATLPNVSIGETPSDSTTVSPVPIVLSPDDIYAINVEQTINDNRRRRFVVPFFCAQTVNDRHVLATEIARGDRVSVYLVEGDESAFHQDADEAIDIAVEVASEIVRRCEGRVLEFVEAQLGVITDLDEDGRLSFVLGHLSEHRSIDCNEQPITGCVRPDDFLRDVKTSGLVNPGGDIVYLDCDLPIGEELDAVLAHELTHAATFCVINQAVNPRCQALPGWLNEAIAHYIEHRINPQSDNLKHRLAEFTNQPHRFPLVIPDSVRQLSLRRGPARAAACLFLSSTLQKMPPDTLRTLVCRPESGTQRLESITGQSFAEVFRSWGLQMMTSHRDFPGCDVSDSGERKLHLAGTAFTWTLPFTESGTLEILAPAESRLQVTVVRSRVPRVVSTPDMAKRLQ